MAKRKVLIIAEIRGLGVMLSLILSKEGYEVTVVDPFGFRSLPKGYTGVDDAMSENKFDLIIPTNSGFPPRKNLELVPEIKKRDPTAKIMVMSGYRPPDLVRQFSETGIDDFMPLPFDVEDFIERVKASLPLPSPLSPLPLEERGDNF
jgi:DNA-binding response OmpR family regulator